MKQIKQFDYFYGKESKQFAYIQIPLELVTNDYYRNLSYGAKFLYGIMLSRMSLSLKSGWFDDENKAYIIYKVEEIQDILNCGKNKAVGLLKELDDYRLIERSKQGLGKPDLIYVLNIFREIEDIAENDENINNLSILENPNLDKVIQENSKSQNSTVARKNIDKKVRGEDYDFFGFENQTSRGLENKLQEFEKQTSRGLENKLQEFEKQTSGVYKSNPSYIDNSYIDNSYIYNNQSINQSSNNNNRIDRWIDVIKHNIAYDDLVSVGNNKETVDEIVNLIVDTVVFNKCPVKINGNSYPAEVVKSTFLKLNYEDIEYALVCLNKNFNKVKNIKSYLIAVLYNTKLTKNNYYISEVNHDMLIKTE